MLAYTVLPLVYPTNTWAQLSNDIQMQPDMSLTSTTNSQNGSFEALRSRLSRSEGSKSRPT